MASNTNPFLTAHYEKAVLTQQTAKRIQRIYKQSAQDIEKKLRNLRMVNPSDSLKKIYLENLLKDINKSSASFNRLVQSTVMSAGEHAGSIAVDAGNKMMKMAGLEIKGAYSYIPRQQVLNIASGKLYGDKWSLSQSIWKSGLRTKSDIQNVVAKGLTENKPIKDIADDLMKYVDPTARKPWDWSKVYPGTAAKVDYNAQRLARTMIQHSFQASLVQSQRYNPFCRGVIWHSVGLHGRTCEQCLERDGNVFPVKDLPLDHPNGLCYFEPALDSMNDVADRLADWVSGGSDPALDTYVAKAFNLSPKSTAGKQIVGAVKTEAKTTVTKSATKSVAKSSKKAAAKIGKIENKGKYIDETFDNLRKKVIQSQKTKESGEEIWKALRKQMMSLDDDHLRYMSTGQKQLKAILPSSDGKAFFSPGKNTITLDLSRDLFNPKGKFTTFFHEYGHLLDHNATAKGRQYFFTFSGEFRKKLYFSLEKDYNKLLREDGFLKPSVRGHLLESEASNGVQDVISGLSKNKNRVKWGHSTEYWNKKGDQGVSLELMAHFNAAMANPEAAGYMKKYFPDTYKLLTEELERYLKAKGLK